MSSIFLNTFFGECQESIASVTIQPRKVV